MNKESRLFFQMVRDFLTVYLPKQKASSPNTIESYRTAMNKYLDYSCNELKIGLDSYTFQHSSRELLEKYLEGMETEGNWSVSSRNQRLAAIRRFYRYAAERNPSVMSCYQEMALIPVKKEAEHEIEFFSEKALEAILAVPDISSKKGRRDLVFMILLYDTGARIQEILDLCLNDLHISSDEKYVVLTGKGGKTRLVPLMQKTVEHLHKYLDEFHRASDGNSFLFYVDRKAVEIRCLRTMYQSLSKSLVYKQRKNVLMCQNISMCICSVIQEPCIFTGVGCRCLCCLNGSGMYRWKQRLNTMRMLIFG